MKTSEKFRIGPYHIMEYRSDMGHGVPFCFAYESLMSFRNGVEVAFLQLAGPAVSYRLN